TRRSQGLSRRPAIAGTTARNIAWTTSPPRRPRAWRCSCLLLSRPRGGLRPGGHSGGRVAVGRARSICCCRVLRLEGRPRADAPVTRVAVGDHLVERVDRLLQARIAAPHPPPSCRPPPLPPAAGRTP